MRRERLSRLAARLRYALLQNPAMSATPRCGACGMLVRPQDFDPKLGVCWGCSADRAEMEWNDVDDDFLPSEDK